MAFFESGAGLYQIMVKNNIGVGLTGNLRGRNGRFVPDQGV